MVNKQATFDLVDINLMKAIKKSQESNFPKYSEERTCRYTKIKERQKHLFGNEKSLVLIKLSWMLSANKETFYWQLPGLKAKVRTFKPENCMYIIIEEMRMHLCTLTRDSYHGMPLTDY